jgi:hypothetical protein
MILYGASHDMLTVLTTSLASDFDGLPNLGSSIVI